MRKNEIIPIEKEADMSMSYDELLKCIGFFREKAEQEKLVIFVGAGVSCNVDGMPSWNTLIQNM